MLYQVLDSSLHMGSFRIRALLVVTRSMIIPAPLLGLFWTLLHVSTRSLATTVLTTGQLEQGATGLSNLRSRLKPVTIRHSRYLV